MKMKWTTNLLVAGALSLAVAVQTLTVARTANAAQEGQEGGKMAKKGGERHPEMREAMRQLRHAKETLQKDAAHDFAGHRVKAIEHIDQAIQEIEEGLKSDRN
jgi:hypothetical protein